MWELLAPNRENRSLFIVGDREICWLCIVGAAGSVSALLCIACSLSGEIVGAAGSVSWPRNLGS